MDYVRLKNMRFFAYHGVRPEEAEKGQRFEVDVELGGNFKAAGTSDNIVNALNYEDIYRIVTETVTENRYNLIETLAETISKRLLYMFPSAKVRVVVRKPDVSLPGSLDAAEIEINR